MLIDYMSEIEQALKPRKSCSFKLVHLQGAVKNQVFCDMIFMSELKVMFLHIYFSGNAINERNFRVNFIKVKCMYHTFLNM